MIKRTLIAIAVVALLASTVHAGSYSIWDPYYFTKTGDGGDNSVKVDGKETKDFFWPYTITYQELTICNIPIVMKVGSYVQIYECSKKKITLAQVNCPDIDKGSGDYPCYLGCVDLKVRANFNVKLGAVLHEGDDKIITGNGGDWSVYYDGGDEVTGNGEYQTVKLCVKSWKSAIYKHAPGDSVSVGSVDVTVKPI